MSPIPDAPTGLVGVTGLDRGRIARILRRPGPRRLAAGLVLAIAGPAALTWLLTNASHWVGAGGNALLYLLVVVVAAVVGGLVPALVCAVVSTGLLNYFFVPPVHTLRVSTPHNVTDLVVFVVTAALVGSVVHRAMSAGHRADRLAGEAGTLAAVAGGIIRGEDALPALVGELRRSFGMTSASLLAPDPTLGWRVEASSGTPAPTRPDEADVAVPAGADLLLVMAGRQLSEGDRRVLDAFAAQAAGLLERDRLAREAASAARLEAADRFRNALLAAVGHDLRSPLASASAAVSSLRATDVEWSPGERAELLATAERSLERLGRLVRDLLDLSRLQAGVFAPVLETVWLDDLVAPALDELGEAARGVVVDAPADLPPVVADPALISRALVNIVANAVRYSPGGRVPRVVVREAGDRVEVAVVDEGPGIPPADRERAFVPFQRLGDTDNRTGLGLGLALSRGLVEAMHGTIEARDTPGGGLTMVLALPTAPDVDPYAVDAQEER
ncbi:MAG: DUF4118 domain-containing protein [Tetrasphaera sp.]|nr:DUF4118 domain-containing protein [Tetrasphaera sp.]